MAPMPEFWMEHSGHLRRFIARRVRDPDAVDDILQDVFIKAHGGLHAVKSRGSVSAWLYRVAANAIADHYRGLKPSEELPDELAAPEPEPDYIAELASCLHPLVDQLPEMYRRPLVLSEIEGLPQKDVAIQLGISLSGAKSRIQRARLMLRQLLFECCDIETGRRGIVGYEVRDKEDHCPCG